MEKPLQYYSALESTRLYSIRTLALQYVPSHRPIACGHRHTPVTAITESAANSFSRHRLYSHSTEVHNPKFGLQANMTCLMPHPLGFPALERSPLSTDK